MPGKDWTEEDFYIALHKLEEESGFVTVDTMIHQVQEAGYLVKNFFHLDTDGCKWRANISKPEQFFEFGNGDDPAEAFQNALYNADLILNHSHQKARKNLRH